MTAPDAAAIEAALAAGLAAHALLGTDCTCGRWKVNRRTTQRGGEWVYVDGPWANQHAAHVAAVLLPVVTQAQAEALRAAADRWTQGAWADVMLPKPAPPAVPVIAYANRMGDWLRARADESGA